MKPIVSISHTSQRHTERGMANKSSMVRFLEPVEIRMGSRYCACRVRLSGRWVPELPDGGEGFQNIKAWSPDGNYLGLVQWRVSRQNEPGFRILTIAVKQRRMIKSGRIRGCCESLNWENGTFTYRAFAINVGRVSVNL